MSPTNCSIHFENRLYPIFQLSMHLHPVQRRRRRDDEVGAPSPGPPCIVVTHSHFPRMIARSREESTFAQLYGDTTQPVSLNDPYQLSIWWVFSFCAVIVRSAHIASLPSLESSFCCWSAPLICPSRLSGTLHLRSADLSQSECCCAFYRRPHILNWVFKKIAKYRGPLFALSPQTFTSPIFKLRLR